MKVIYRDNYLLGVHKPAGLPTYRESKDSGAEGCKELLEEELTQRLFPVHRIDADTSGVVLFALFVCSFSSCKLCIGILMSRATTTKLETIKVKHYKINLVKKQDWAGPACYVYELKKQIIVLPVYYKIAKKQVWCKIDTICFLDFERERKKTVHLNFCTDKTIKRKKKNGYY